MEGEKYQVREADFNFPVELFLTSFLGLLISTWRRRLMDKSGLWLS
jgi:hypothetical protein